MKENKTEKIQTIEKEKNSERAFLQERLDLINKDRGELLILFATGDQGASAKIAALQKERAAITVQIEAIDALLSSIPMMIKQARAEEIEADMQELDRLMLDLQECAPAIDDAAEKFVLAMKRQVEIINKLRSLNTWAFQDYYAGVGVGSIPYFFEKHGLQQVDKRANNQPIVEGLEKSHLVRQIKTVRHHMQQSVNGLKGEAVDNRNGYCPRCYGVGQRFAPDSNKIICAKCGKTIRE